MSPPAPRLLVAVGLGGATGAVLRALLGDLVPEGPGFPWTTFAINVAGALVLATLPVLGPVRRSPTLAVGLGAGLVGGFTTLSAASEQVRALLDDGRTGTAAAYLVGTLAAALVAVALASRVVGPVAGAAFEAEEGDR